MCPTGTGAICDGLALQIETASQWIGDRVSSPTPRASPDKCPLSSQSLDARGRRGRVRAIGDAEPLIVGLADLHAGLSACHHGIHDEGDVQLRILLLALLLEEPPELRSPGGRRGTGGIPRDSSRRARLPSARAAVPSASRYRMPPSALLDLLSLDDSLEEHVFVALGDASRHGPVFAQGVLEGISDHGVAIGRDIRREKGGYRLERVDAVVVVGVDHGERPANGLAAYENRMAGAPGLLAVRRQREIAETGVQLLVGVVRLDETARTCC